MQARRWELVEDLRSTVLPMEEKEEVATMLAALTTQDRSKAPGLVKAGAIEPLVALLTEGTETNKMAAAASRAGIAARYAAHQQQIVQAGGVKPIVKLLQGSPGTQEQAIHALAAVSEDVTHQQAIIKTGALKHVVKLLEGGKGHSKEHAASATANLTTFNPEAQATAVELGALPLLLRLLQSGKELAQVQAARALSKLAHSSTWVANQPVQEAFQDLDGIAPLLTLLNARNIEATVQAAAAVAELARDNVETQDDVARAGGIAPLLALISKQPPTPAAQSNAANALAQLAKFNRENQDSMARMEAIPSLSLLLIGQDHLNPDVQSMAAMAMAEICRDNEPNQTAAADLGVIASLVVLLNRTNIPTVKAEVAGAIWTLSDLHAANKTSFASAGAAKPLVGMLDGSAGERGENHAVHALASMGFENLKNLTQVTTLLVALLGFGDMHAKSTAATTLWRLVQENPDANASIASAGAAADLVTLLKGGTEAAKSYALWALSLSIDETNQEVVLEEGGVRPLVNFLVSPDQTVRTQAAAALARLATKWGKTQLAITKAGAIVPLIDMLDADTNVAAAQEWAAATLAELALLKKVRDTIVLNGGVSLLVALLREGRNDGKKFAARALARLAHEQDEVAEAISDSGGDLAAGRPPQRRPRRGSAGGVGRRAIRARRECRQSHRHHRLRRHRTARCVARLQQSAHARACGRRAGPPLHRGLEPCHHHQAARRHALRFGQGAGGRRTRQPRERLCREPREHC